MIYVDTAPNKGRQSEMAHELLRQALRNEHGIVDFEIAREEKGKPYLATHPDIHFNLSHCRTAVACIVDSQPVGIDVESIRQAKPDLVAYTMNAEEQQRISTADDPDREFTILWTRKEALLKLRGTGIGAGKVSDVLSTEPRARIDTVVAASYVMSVARYDNMSAT